MILITIIKANFHIANNSYHKISVIRSNERFVVRYIYTNCVMTRIRVGTEDLKVIILDDLTI